MKLWLVQELLKIEEFLENNIKAMAMRAEIEIEVCMPGYVMSILDFHEACGSKTNCELDTPIYNELNRKPDSLLVLNSDGS